MVFSSLTFLSFFFPCVLGLYYLSRSRTYRNMVLLAASLLFYSWGEPKALWILLGVTLAAYLGALAIEKTRGSRPGLCRAALAITVALIVLDLFVFKYLGFAVRELERLTGPIRGFRELALPIGISFFTFQALSYVIDLYHGRIRLQRDPLKLLLYISLFPQLIAGPIVRYAAVERELEERRERAEDVWQGLLRFIEGLAKKVILANNISLICEAVYHGYTKPAGTAAWWLAALAYTLQIYFDFSGYSDMAIGLGRIFGFRFPENFDRPYRALSVTEFWRRWHISLSSWFRDYVYIPLGGNRVPRGRWLANLLIVWMLTGLWHGAAWNFLLWGLYYALLLIGEKLLWGRRIANAPKPLRWLYCFVLVMLGWVLFYHSDLTALGQALAGMFRPVHTSLSALAADPRLLLGLPFLALGLFSLCPAWDRLTGRLPNWLDTAAHLLLLGVSVQMIVSSGYNPFLYFRF